MSALGGALAAAPAARVAVPYPTAATPRALDRGPLEAQSPDTPIALTIALRLRDLDAAEKLLQSVSTPGDPQYHHFLSAEQFTARFAPSKADAARVVAALGKYALSAEQTTATTLRVSGRPADIERAFSVSLHSYEVPAHGDAPGYSFHAPLSRATLPAEISTSVAAVVGLDNRPSLHPYHVHASLARAPLKPAEPDHRLQSGPSYTLNPFGYLTVTDFAHLYDVEPLYSRGITGHGRTIGIMSLANFTPSDAYDYWSALGLTVNPDRIQVFYVDGGPGAPSDASGSLETTLDVEQSGGVAPGANINVYLAPNTNQGFVDVFATAIDANTADSLSISWGEWEWFENLQNSPVTDPTTGRVASVLQATHELLVRAGIQGQTIITASGDGGAYEANHDLGCFGPYSPTQPLSCSLVLSVSYPGTDPAITAGGGTTLPGIQEFCLNAACTPPYYVIDIQRERVWGWDYLIGLCQALGLTIPECGIFPAGSGGGVSVFFADPLYQLLTSGTRLSQPGQVFIAGAEIVEENGVVGTYFALPGFYLGRNVPDVSFNADPETGYIVFYTSNVSGFAEEPFWGGTSFVAPQLNGVSSLLGQYVKGRLGLLNYALYSAQGGQGSRALNPIVDGDNWFYHGGRPYSPAAGLGTLDVANFAEYLHRGW